MKTFQKVEQPSKDEGCGALFFWQGLLLSHPPHQITQRYQGHLPGINSKNKILWQVTKEVKFVGQYFHIHLSFAPTAKPQAKKIVY